MEWLAVISITLLAVISPGPDFAMVTRCSLLYGKKAGVLVAWGIALGVQVHVCYSVLGVAWLLQHSPLWLTAFKLVGAAYLVWIGWQTWRSPALPAASALPDSAQPQADTMRSWAALRTGFFTNALNPKTTLFVVSVFSQVVQPGAPWWALAGYGLFISIAHGVWFGAVLMALGAALALAR